jgi:uncharacterized protein (DUF3084 family)
LSLLTEAEIKSLKDEIKQKDETIKARDAQIKHLNSVIKQRDDKIKNLEMPFLQKVTSKLRACCPHRTQPPAGPENSGQGKQLHALIGGH